MKTLSTYLLLFFFNVVTISAQQLSHGKIIPDDFSVTNSMMGGSYGKRLAGELISMDKAWFSNDTIKQTLVFDLYTDYHRLYTYLFYNDNIPVEIINGMGLNVQSKEYRSTYDQATHAQKQANFKGFIASATKINRRYFISNKGFKLGANKQEACNVYGNPELDSTFNAIEICKWKFESDITADGKPAKSTNGKPLAKDSFGYEVTMFFKNNKLVAMILFNDIP